jgi:hypothetical protein
VKCWASVHLGEAGLLVPPAEYQVTVFIPSMENLAFWLFNGVGSRGVVVEQGLSCC